MDDRSRLRVGAVRYLNTKPLIYAWSKFVPQADLVLDVPSRLADDLASSQLDVALIPSVEFFHNPGYSIVSDAAIACRGPVLSVKLFSRTPIEAIRTLALDEGSRTSAALVQILLAERYGVRPELRKLPLGTSFNESDAEAVMLIGDRAMYSPGGSFEFVWDLGDQWCRWTNLPFVFAMWVARPGAELASLGISLGLARDAGVANLDEIAAQEAAALGLTQPQCVSYLRDNLYFYLGSRELAGLELFYEKAAALGLAPTGVELEFKGCRAAG
ncbi:MAG TPA: menaquinone biosynthesis protein [Pirellulales bacterium]|jgi:chorismate dehydratase|nr:menaquinone biosynthesis protein [Pirellulales bacterium]